MALYRHRYYELISAELRQLRFTQIAIRRGLSGTFALKGAPMLEFASYDFASSTARRARLSAGHNSAAL